MTTTNTDTPTPTTLPKVTGVIAERAAEIRSLTERLLQRVTEYESEPVPNWGAAGDLGRILDSLSDLGEGLGL